MLSTDHEEDGKKKKHHDEGGYHKKKDSSAKGEKGNKWEEHGKNRLGHFIISLAL